MIWFCNWDWTNLSNLYHRIVPNWITFGNYLTLKSKPSKFFNLKYSISFRRFSMTSTLCQARRPRLPLAAGRERHGHRSGVVGDAQRGGWMVAAGVKSIGYWHGWEIQTIHVNMSKPIEYNGLGPRMVTLFFFLKWAIRWSKRDILFSWKIQHFWDFEQTMVQTTLGRGHHFQQTNGCYPLVN